jgi:hypothetical protein
VHAQDTVIALFGLDTCMVADDVRRRLLAAGATGLAGALAGCTSLLSTGDGRDGGSAGDEVGSDGAHPTTGFPLRDEPFAVEDDFETLRGFVLDAGVPKDGIPPIEEPAFAPPAEIGDDVLPNDPVFGVSLNGDARAYTQSILVQHEIVNDSVGGVPVSVTYCPLTGSALGFYRGENSFGTTGHLLNSNLVMYDRDTDSRWPQLLGTAIEGEHEGRSLQGVRVTWTTYDAWTTAHPETRVLTEDTGFVRNYDIDPYGTYNPKAGYYATQGQLYDPVRDPGRTPPKLVLVAARTPTGSFAASKERLREDRIVGGDAGDVPVVAVYDPELDTGYVYRRGDATVETATGAADGTYRVDGGDPAPAAALDLDRVRSFDVMWFAWNALYPTSDTYT